MGCAPEPFKCLVVAGESSGDRLAAAAIAALRRRLAQDGRTLVAWGTGGGALREAGVDVLHGLETLAVLGLTEVVRAYPRLKRIQRELIAALDRSRPDAVLLVDYVEFNLGLGRAARERGIPVLFYVSPQVWAWRPRRIERIRRAVSAMAVLFPFEVEVYRAAGIPVRHVGHPLTERPPPDPDAPVAAQLRRWLPDTPPQNLPRADPVLVGLLPGSRRSEVQRLWPVLLELADQLHARHPDWRFAVPIADGVAATLVDRIAQDARSRPHLCPVVGPDAARHVLGRARAAVVASGTVTLEAAWLDCPMLVVYRVSALTYWVLKRMIRIPNIALVNIVAGEEIAPEFLQRAARADVLRAPLERLVADGPERARQRAGLARVRDALRAPNAADAVADFLLETVRNETARPGPER